MRIKRVLMTSYFYEFRFGGAELVARTVKRNLETQCGLDVDVLCLGGSLTPEPEPNIHRVSIPDWWLRSPQLFKRIVLFLNNRFFDKWFVSRASRLDLPWPDYDLIHCEDLNALGATHTIAGLQGLPVVFTLHDTIPKRLYPGQASRAVTRFLDRRLNRRAGQLIPALRACRQILCVSRFVQRSLIQLLNAPSTSAPETLRVIYPPIEEYLGHITGQNSGPIDTSSGKLLFIGRLSKEKGIDLLVRAMGQLPPGVTLSILGLDGPLRTQIESEARQSTAIVLLPTVPHSEVQSVLLTHDVICCPSMFEEPFGKTVLEARLTSKPVVATDLGGIPEILTGYQRAFLVSARSKSEPELIRDFAAAIRVALESGSRPLDAAAERSFLRQFELPSVLEAHLTAYQQSMVKPGTSSGTK